MANKYDCPHICPGYSERNEKKNFSQAGSNEPVLNVNFAPYTPGIIQPPEKKVYPPNAPPKYLPQPTDSTSGDMLGMGPIGPWAGGHMDWTPQAGITGTRPVVDKYSITLYSTGEWRKNNQFTLTPIATNKAKTLDASIKKDIENTFQNLDNQLADTNLKLKNRIKDLVYWKKEVEKVLKAMSTEIKTLDKDRAKLKGACRILMLPESISRECLELRTHRYEPDMVRDDAEQELIKEVAIVGVIRTLFQDTLAKVEEQMVLNKAAKTSLESDWSDKMVTLKIDGQNLNLDNNSNLILYHIGVNRWPENATSLEYWEHFCKESVQNCEKVRKMSENLREQLKSIIIKGSQDMKTQSDRTNAALAEAIDATKQMCNKLEETLTDNLKTTADIENLIDHLKDSLRKVGERNKLVMTRLHNRNYSRPNVENCRDEAQYALISEAKFIKETVESLNNKIRQAEVARSELMKYRSDLEKDIACKRKSLLIDEDRIARARYYMPTPEEFANA